MSAALDPPLLASLEVLERARSIVALAFDDGHIDAFERDFFVLNLEDSPTHGGVPCALARTIVSELGLLVSTTTRLGERVADFLRTTPPSRGGFFMHLDLERGRIALLEVAPRADERLQRDLGALK